MVDLLASRAQVLLGFEAAQLVLEPDPQNMSALYWQAEAARRLAQTPFQQSVSLSPNSWQGHILLGDIFRQRKQRGQAIFHYIELPGFRLTRIWVKPIFCLLLYCPASFASHELDSVDNGSESRE